LGFVFSKCQITVIKPAIGLPYGFPYAIPFNRTFYRSAWWMFVRYNCLPQPCGSAPIATSWTKCRLLHLILLSYRQRVVSSSCESLTCCFIVSFDFLKRLLSTQPLCQR